MFLFSDLVGKKCEVREYVGLVESADDGIGALKDDSTDNFKEKKRLWGSETYEVKACQHGAKSNNGFGAVNG